MKKILFVEDDPILTRVYCRALTAAGFDVEHAAHGEAGLAKLQIQRPDLILLDLMLPRVSGMDLLRIVRTSEGVKDTPVVIFSSALRAEVRTELEALGASRLLSKAEFVPRQVVAVIRELLPGSGRVPPRTAVEGERDEGPGESAQVAAIVRESARLIQELNREVSFDHRGNRLRQLHGEMLRLSGAALAIGGGPQAYFAEAVALLLSEFLDRTSQLERSTLRTVTQSVDFLRESFEPGRRFTLSGREPFKILTVDDDSISRCGVQLALGRIKQKAVECADSATALELTGREPFDLIFLDVELPGTDGFEICAQMRRSGVNRATPVVFVTRHADLERRAQATMSGATDLIPKPFNFTELAVKALYHLLRSKLR